MQQNKHNLKEDKQTLSEKAVDDEKSKTEVVENTNSEDDIILKQNKDNLKEDNQI